MIALLAAAAVLTPGPCPAMAMWQTFASDVPVQDETRSVRAQVAYGLGQAEQASRAAEPLAAARQCLESVQAYRSAVDEFYYGTLERDALNGHATEVAATLQRKIDLLVAALPPEPPERRYKRRAIGLLISGGLVAIPTLILRVTVSVSDNQLARGPADARSGCIESCYLGTVLNPAFFPLQALTAGLLGGGMRSLGRWAAIRDAHAGVSDASRAHRLTWLGVGVMGAGLATFVGTQVVSHTFAYDSVAAVGIRDAGWWVATLSLPAGAGLMGYGTGYRKQSLMGARRAASVAPRVSRDVVGLSVSGRI